MKWYGVVNGVRLDRVVRVLAEMEVKTDVTPVEAAIADRVRPLVAAMRAKGYGVREVARFAKREAAMLAAEQT